MDEHSLMVVCVYVTLNVITVRCRPHLTSCILETELHVNDCMESFLRIHKRREDTHEIPVIDEFFNKQLCQEYERMLVCLHTFLTECQTTHARHHVRHTLGNQWIQNVNELCEIQIKATQEEQQREYTHLDNQRRQHHSKNTTKTSHRNGGRRMKKIEKELSSFHQLFLLHLKGREFSSDTQQELEYFKSAYSLFNIHENRIDDPKNYQTQKVHLSSDNEAKREHVEENVISYKMTIENNYYTSSVLINRPFKYWGLCTMSIIISLLNTK